MKCNYCKLDAVVEHCELRYTEHLSKPDQCPNAPEPVRKEALQRLATKRGALSSTPINELGTPLNPHVVGDDDADDNEVSYEKAEFDRFQLRPSDPQAQDTVQ